MDNKVPTMQDLTRNPQGLAQGHSLPTEIRNVLRNTYLLLALTMVPTILGAWLGVAFGVDMARLLPTHPIVSAILFLAIAFGLMWGVSRNRNSGLGVALLLLFTGMMGTALSAILNVALNLSNGPMLVAMAAGGTGVTFFALSSYVQTTKRDFSHLGKFLFVGVVVLILASIANMFFHVPALALTISAVAVVLFSLFLLYDLQRVVQGGETNYIMATLAVYLDLYNIFVNLLNILMAFMGQRE